MRTLLIAAASVLALMTGSAVAQSGGTAVSPTVPSTTTSPSTGLSTSGPGSTPGSVTTPGQQAGTGGRVRAILTPRGAASAPAAVAPGAPAQLRQSITIGGERK